MKQTFLQLAEAWFAVEKKRLADSHNEKTHLRHLEPLWAETEETLTPRRAGDVLLSLLRPVGRLSACTVNKVRSTGRRVIRAAQYNREWLLPNPFDVVQALRTGTRVYRTLTLEGARGVLRQMDRPKWRETAFNLVLGPRPGETWALRKEDVLPGQCLVHIHRSNGRDSTKTGRERMVPVPHSLWGVVVEAMAASRTEFVFPRADGTQQSGDDRPCEVIRRALQWANVEMKGFRWYDVRHSSATLHAEAGCDPWVIALTLGHAMRDTTAHLYRHHAYEYQREQLEKMAARLLA